MRKFDRGNRRGQSIVLVAIALFALMGVAALAIDLGMLQKARAEAQRAADAAALAGASAYLLDSTVDQENGQAVLRAKEVAGANYMNGVTFDTATEVTVWTISDSQKVRVRVRRAAVPTWFAQIFGIKTVAVGARAAAVADYASGSKCVKPIALPDLWDDTGDLVANGGDGDHFPDPTESWLYQNPPDTYYRAGYNGVDGSGTGYGSMLRGADRDWGLQIVLRPSVNPQDQPLACPGDLQGGKCYIPGWWGLWGEPGLTDDMLRACSGSSKNAVLDTATYSVGTPYEIKTGWTQSLNKIVESLINEDQNAHWDGSVKDVQTGNIGTIVGSKYGDNWRAADRVWILGVFDPNYLPAASGDVTFNNLMTFFVEGCVDVDGTGGFHANCKPSDLLVGRFMGAAQGTATGPSPGTMIRILRLVE